MKVYLVIGLLLAIAVFYLISKRKPATPASAGASRNVEFLTEPEADGWYDVRFKCSVEQKEGTRLFHLRNDFEGHEVGIDVEVAGTLRTAIVPDKQEQLQIDSERLKGLEIQFVRAGDQSDRFIQTLDRLYQTKLGRKHMVKSFRFDAIPLAGEESGLAKVKLFGNSNGAEEEYFELYLNIHFREGWAEIAEKDPDYRVPTMKALSTE